MFTVASGNEEPNKTPRPAGSLPTPKIRRGLRSFFAETVREMKKVNWPAHSETNRLTGVVLVVCLFVVLFLSLSGFVFGKIIEFVARGGL